MWLVFDQLWSSSAAVEMKRLFISNLRLLAKITRGPVSKDFKTAIEEGYSLREAINTNFDLVRQQGDGIMLEFGSSRDRDLAMRAQLLTWQLQLRSLFIARIALLKYRLQLPGFELPVTIQAAQREFDERLASTLENIAERLAGRVLQRKPNPENFFSPLEHAVQNCCSSEPPEQVAAPLRTFLTLSFRIETLVRSLERGV
jgi:multidrug resistance protein MdtO